MNAYEWAGLAVTFIASVFGSRFLSTIWSFWRSEPKTKAETVQINAEAEKTLAEAAALKVDDQTQIIQDLRTEIQRLKADRDNLEARVTKIERHYGLLNQWAQKVWILLTPEQQLTAGPIPAD